MGRFCRRDGQDIGLGKGRRVSAGEGVSVGFNLALDDLQPAMASGGKDMFEAFTLL